MKKINILIFTLLFSMFNILVVYSETNHIIIDDDNNMVTYNNKVYTYEIDDDEIVLKRDECIFTNSISSYTSSIGVNNLEKCSEYIDEVSPIFEEIAKKYNMTMKDLRDKTEEEEIQKQKEENTPILVLLILVLVIIGLINIVEPKISWKFGYGLYIKNAEPTEFSLMIIRLSGVVITLISIILFVSFLGL